MLKTYRIIPLVFILFLFGLPLMTSSGFSFGVASAFKGKVKRTITTMTNAVAKDKTTAEFVECQQMKSGGMVKRRR